jgi:hypothetical protein
MRSRKYCFALVALAIAGLGGAAAYARADGGGPSPGISIGWDGIVAPNGKVRYVTLSSGRNTVVAVVSIHGGRVLRFGWLRGSYGVPLVAYDGSTGGLSHDGTTLVLGTQLLSARPAVSRFAIVDTKTFRLLRTVALPGMFSFDALSPDAKTLYLIQYVDERNYAHYLVRAYDLGAGKLLPQRIADKRELKEAMSGSPMRRVTSADGTWVYTLYQKPKAKPFIHALNAAHRFAVCIDLPWIGSQARLWQMQLALSANESKLALGRRGAAPTLVVDTKTFRVTRA